MRSTSRPSSSPASAPLKRVGSGVVVAREERRFPRHRVALSANVASLDAVRDADGVPCYVVTTGRTLDVGDGGLALEIDSELEEGRRVLVEVTLADGIVLERAAKVVWRAHDATHAYVGVQFEEPVPGLAHKT